MQSGYTGTTQLQYCDFARKGLPHPVKLASRQACPSAAYHSQLHDSLNPAYACGSDVPRHARTHAIKAETSRDDAGQSLAPALAGLSISSLTGLGGGVRVHGRKEYVKAYEKPRLAARGFHADQRICRSRFSAALRCTALLTDGHQLKLIA